MTIKIPYQENAGNLVALLPDGRVRFCHRDAQPFIDDINKGEISPASVDFDKYILKYADVDLNRFHLSAPAIAFIETTNLCNLRCEHCYAFSGDRREKEMSTEKIKELMDEYEKMGVLQVFLTGGELFAHHDALELIKYARTKPFSTQIFTNGLLITEEKLKEIPRGQSFFVSFDTAVPERSIRGKMNFPKLKKCFDLMKKHGHVFRTAISAHNHNVGDIEQIFEWCIENDYPRPQWLETHPIGRALLNPHIILQPDRVDEVLEIYVRCMDRFQKGGQSEMSESSDEVGQADTAKKNDHSEIQGIDTIKFCQTLEKATGQEKCGRTFAYVNSSGDVFPCSNCMSNNMYVAGNIHDSSFQDIWENGFNEFRDKTFTDFKQCGDCDVQKSNILCQFRCPPLSKNVTGEEDVCGATDYLKQFMLKSNDYWNLRKNQGYTLHLLARKK